MVCMVCSVRLFSNKKAANYLLAAFLDSVSRPEIGLQLRDL